MKARNREVNIFNMSLLDVLCGALGAFCFLMLALFPYYKPKDLSAEDMLTYKQSLALRQQLQQLQAQLSKAGPAGASGMISKVQNALAQAQQQMAQEQQTLGRTQAAMQQAQQQLRQQQATIDMKQPMLVENWYPADQPVGMYIRTPGEGTHGEKDEAFDPKKDQITRFKDSAGVSGPGSGTQVIGDTVSGDYEVYYRLQKPEAATGEISVLGYYHYATGGGNLPTVKLSSAHPYIRLGKIRVDSAQGKVTFVAGTDVGAPPNSSAPPEGKKEGR